VCEVKTRNERQMEMSVLHWGRLSAKLRPDVELQSPVYVTCTPRLTLVCSH
jgi:hypothetical protein